MKILLLSTSDLQGGAARAAYRLHQGLRAADADSQMLVQAKASDDGTVVAPQTKLAKALTQLQSVVDALPLTFYPQREAATFSAQWFPSQIAAQVTALAPEIINLHWVCGSYLPIETLAKFDQPLVWTLHDMWAFTGGCHYSLGCDRYTSSCGSCPQLHSHRDWDLSRWVWQRKAKAWRAINLTIVTPSVWLAQCARASSLFRNRRIEVIPNGLDLTRYKLLDKRLAKSWLGLPTERPMILFGAAYATSDHRKGIDLLLPALQKLSQTEAGIELVIYGASQPEQPPDFGFKAHYFGKLSDDIALALLYAAADVFVAPSRQDNLPNTIVEALACGTPCVAFKVGGLPDMIEHQQNGYLAHPYDTDDLAQGIAWVLNNECYQQLSDRAREKAQQEFSQERQAQRYLTLFGELTAQAQRPASSSKSLES
ncbi:MAG: glycosyltransferase family 4 protein [Cyanophyceae cyanobacterium]